MKDFVRSDMPSKKIIASLEDLRRSYNLRYTLDPIEAPEEHYRWVLEKLRPIPGKTLLDVACGKGRFLKISQEQGLKVYGIDISEIALAQARDYFRTPSLALASGESLPFRDNFFDYITNLGSLEHFLSPENGVQEMARIIKPEGIVGILLPNLYPLFEILHVLKTGYGRPRNQDLERFESLNDWQDLLEENGLKVLKIYGDNGCSKKLKHVLLKPFIPLRLAHHFLFICQKK